MEEHYEGGVKKEIYKKDLRALTSQIKEHKSLLRLKRRWLMDLPLSRTEEKRLEKLLPPNDKTLPESLLREDDASYEDIIACVEKAFGAYNNPVVEYQPAQEDDNQILKSHNDIKDLISLLDSMTSKALYFLAKILNVETTQFVKTNLSIKKAIKGHLLESKNCISEVNTKQLVQLLKDSNSFRDKSMMMSTPSQAYSDEALKVLDALGDFSFRTLNAMLRRLNDVEGSIPTFERKTFDRGSLVKYIRVKFHEMLPSLRISGEPSKPLAGALGVAGLDLKLLLNRPSAIDFRKFPPDVEALQKDIAKAILLINSEKIVTLEELEKLQLLLDPSFTTTRRDIRFGMRFFLTDYLFECGDMDEIPDNLVEALGIINNRKVKQKYQFRKRRRSSRSCNLSPKESMVKEIQREVEYVSSLSAQGKGVILDWFPDHGFDEDFAQAYIEDFGESDEDELINDISQHSKFLKHNSSYGLTESVGETRPTEFDSPMSKSEFDGCSSFLSLSERFNPALFNESKIHNCESMQKNANPSGGCNVKSEPVLFDSVNVATKKQNSVSVANLYVEVQEACDVASIEVYRSIGQMLDDLVKTEGVELCQSDRSYLLNGASVTEDSQV